MASDADASWGPAGFGSGRGGVLDFDDLVKAVLERNRYMGWYRWSYKG